MKHLLLSLALAAAAPAATTYLNTTGANWPAGDKAAFRTAAGLAVGTNVQAWDADLTTWAGVTPATGIGVFLATPTSANFATAITDETGTGAMVFANSPTFTGTVGGITKSMVGLGNVDNTRDSDKPIGDLTQAALDAKASAAVEAPSESLASTILVHDSMSGVATTLALNGTRNALPGPGVATLALAPTGSITRWEFNELILTTPTVGQGPTLHYGAQTAAPGLTMIARLIPACARGSAGITTVGFSDTATRANRRGIISLVYDTAVSKVPVIQFGNQTSGTDQSVQSAVSGGFGFGEEIAVAIQYVSLTKRRYWMQGGNFKDFGATVGSDNWILLGEDQNAVDFTGTVYPFVTTQNDGAARIKDVRVLTSWNPSPRHTALDYDCPSTAEPTAKNGTHVPAIKADPVTGLLVAAWQRAADDINQDAEIRYSTRLASGQWTAPATFPGLEAVAGPGDALGMGHLSVVGNSLWIVYSKRPSAADGGTLHYRVCTVNATTGAITLGTQQSFSGISGTANLSFSNIVTLPSGRLVMPYQNAASGAAARVAYSDDNGGTWSTVQISASVPGGATSLVEPTLAVESAGALGVYLRNASGSAYYSRSTDGGATWSAVAQITSIPQVGGGSRMIVCSDAAGQNYLIGNDHKTIRRAVTIWKIGDSAAILGKRFLGDWNGPDDSGLMQYPTACFDGLDLVFAYSCRAFNNTVSIQTHTIRWSEGVPVENGGTGVQSGTISVPRWDSAKNTAVKLAYSTAPVPDMYFARENGGKFYLTLTASTAVIGVPLNPLPWEPISIRFIQGGAGSFTATFNAVFEFNGITPTWQTAVNATNTLRAEYNPLTAKWVVTGWN